VSCLYTTMPQHTGHLQQRRNWPIWASIVLITTIFLVSSPFGNHLFPGLKKQWKDTIFRPTLRSFLPRKPGWTEKFLFFFWVAFKC
jgi:hypothetical protein